MIGQALAAIGLRLLPSDGRAAIRAGTLAVVGVALGIVTLDAQIFRAVLPGEYVAHYTAPLWPRMASAVAGSAWEELLYRLLAMTAIAALPVLAGRRPGPGWMAFAIVAAQALNVGGLVLAMPAYASLRFWLVGCVWGWLYWRHGFATALISHAATHLLLDPALKLVLN